MILNTQITIDRFLCLVQEQIPLLGPYAARARHLLSADAAYKLLEHLSEAWERAKREDS